MAYTFAILGATGGTGAAIAAEAASRGHGVLALARRPEAVDPLGGAVQPRLLTLDRPLELVQSLRGANVVVSALGQGGLKASARPTTLYSDTTRALLVALRELEIRRFLVISSGGVEYDAAAPWFYRALIRPYLINNYLDMMKMETILEQTEELDWTSVRPTYLKEGPSRPYRVRNRKVQGGSFTIHRVDVAAFVVNEAEKCNWVRQYPTLGY